MFGEFMFVLPRRVLVWTMPLRSGRRVLSRVKEASSTKKHVVMLAVENAWEILKTSYEQLQGASYIAPRLV